MCGFSGIFYGILVGLPENEVKSQCLLYHFDSWPFNQNLGATRTWGPSLFWKDPTWDSSPASGTPHYFMAIARGYTRFSDISKPYVCICIYNINIIMYIYIYLYMYCCLVNSLKQNHKLSILTGSPHVISHEISNPLIKRCLRGAERGRDDSLCHQGASVRVQTAPRRERVQRVPQCRRRYLGHLSLRAFMWDLYGIYYMGYIYIWDYMGFNENYGIFIRYLWENHGISMGYLPPFWWDCPDSHVLLPEGTLNDSHTNTTG